MKRLGLIGLLLVLACGGAPMEVGDTVITTTYRTDRAAYFQIVELPDGTRCAILKGSGIHCDWSDR